MNHEIEALTKDIWKESVEVWEELQRIRCTLINIKISVARINTVESEALNAVATQLEQAIQGITQNTARIRDQAKKIGEINRGIEK